MLEFVGELLMNFNENIYEMTHDVFQNQQLDCYVKILLRLTSKKT